MTVGIAIPVLGSLPEHARGPLDWWLSAALVLPLLARRRQPAVVLGVQLAAVTVQLLTTRMLVADLALLVSVHSIALHRPRRPARWAAGLVEVYALATAVVLRPSDDGRIASALFSSGLVAAAYFSGTSGQDRRAYLAALVDRAERLEREQARNAQLAVTTERTRIARELHDIVAHSLAVMITLSDAARAAGGGTPAAQRASEQVSATGREAMSEMRRLLGVLREDSGPAPLAPQPGADQLEDLVAPVRAAGPAVQLSTSGEPAAASDSVVTTVYRVVQEALTNVLRHAQSPTRVTVTVAWGASDVEVTVDDDGRPAPDDGAAGATGDGLTGHGLVGMRERVQLFDGTLQAGPVAGGWRVRARIPFVPVPAR